MKKQLMTALVILSGMTAFADGNGSRVTPYRAPVGPACNGGIRAISYGEKPNSHGGSSPFYAQGCGSTAAAAKASAANACSTLSAGGACAAPQVIQ